MRGLILVALFATALARHHPRPARDDVSRSLAKEKRAEITEGVRGAEGSLHSVAKKAAHAKGHAKPADPEAEEKAREATEHDAKALEESKKSADKLNEELAKKRSAKAKLSKDLKMMHQALTVTTTTTREPELDTHILDLPAAPENQTKVVVPPTAAQLAKLSEEKLEKEEHIREAEDAAKRDAAASKKKAAGAKKLKEQERRLHSEATALKSESGAKQSVEGSVKADESAVAKLMKEVGQLPKPAISASVAKAVSAVAPEKPEVQVAPIVAKADEDAKRVLNTKTHPRSKAAQARTQEEIESEARSTAASLHAASMDENTKKVEADLKEQMRSVKEMKAATKFTATKAVMDDLAKEAKLDVQKPAAPHKMFRPAKFDPTSPASVAKKNIEEVGAREGELQNKMQNMMGSMEKIREQIGH